LVQVFDRSAVNERGIHASGCFLRVGDRDCQMAE
jgi:hypothetical protein